MLELHPQLGARHQTLEIGVGKRVLEVDARPEQPLQVVRQLAGGEHVAGEDVLAALPLQEQDPRHRVQAHAAVVGVAQGEHGAGLAFAGLAEGDQGEVAGARLRLSLAQDPAREPAGAGHCRERHEHRQRHEEHDLSPLDHAFATASQPSHSVAFSARHTVRCRGPPRRGARRGRGR